MTSAVNDELLDSNPCRITGAGRAKRVHKIRPASIDELATVTAAMPERLRLKVILASWCAKRFGETVELRRGDVDLGDEVIRIRRAAVRTQGGTFSSGLRHFIADISGQGIAGCHGGASGDQRRRQPQQGRGGGQCHHVGGAGREPLAIGRERVARDRPAWWRLQRIGFAQAKIGIGAPAAFVL